MFEVVTLIVSLRSAGYCSWMELRYASIAVISSGSKTNSGISGWPTESPSASDSASSSMGYLRAKVRNGGAAECGLSPVRAMAWQCAHRASNNSFPRPSRFELLGVGKLRENGSGNRNERQVDGGTHASGSSLNEAPNRGGYSEKGVFLRSDTALQYPFCDAPRAIRLLQKFGPGR